MDTSPPLSAATPIRTTIGALVFAGGVVAGWLGSYLGITHKLADLEIRTTRLENKVNIDHDILTRIDANVAAMQRHLDKTAK